MAAQTADLMIAAAQLLLAAQEHYEQFAREQSDDPAVMTEAATAWFRLGKIQGALGNTAGRQQAVRSAPALSRAGPQVSRSPRLSV